MWVQSSEDVLGSKAFFFLWSSGHRRSYKISTGVLGVIQEATGFLPEELGFLLLILEDSSWRLLKISEKVLVVVQQDFEVTEYEYHPCISTVQRGGHQEAERMTESEHLKFFTTVKLKKKIFRNL